MYPPPFVVLLMDCPASLDLAAYFNSAADTLIGVNFPLGTPWALGKVDRVTLRCGEQPVRVRLGKAQTEQMSSALPR
jgi:hypothetical protein